MKTEIVSRENAAEFDAFVAAHPKGHFLQTSLWGKVKYDWKWFGVIARRDNGEIAGTLAVLARQISKLPYHMLYAPRGPVCDLTDKETFFALVEGAKAEGKKNNAYMLKIDTDVPADNEDYAAMIREAGFEQQPRFVLQNGSSSRKNLSR